MRRMSVTMHGKAWRIRGFLILFLLGATGCSSRQDELTRMQTYTEEMQNFCDAVSSCQERIDAVEVSAENAGEEILLAVDEMAEAAASAAQVSVPEGYEEAGELCKKASDYLQEAKGEYHAAFDTETVDQSALHEGDAAYQSAGRCISLMLEALRQTGE